MKKFFSLILAALMLAGTTATVSAAEGEVVNLIGYAEIIGQNATAQEPLLNVDKTTPEQAFDGNITTCARGGNAAEGAVEGGSDYWVGIYLEQPAILTSFKYATYDTNGDGASDRVHAINGQTVEGSNDGENWEFIYRCDDWDYEDYQALVAEGQNYFTKELTGDKAYSYYRIWNNCDGIALWAEVEFHGILIDEEDVLDYIVGDLNADEDIDILDSLLMVRHVLMPDLYPLEDYASEIIDFNNDGETSIQDARYIFLHGMDPEKYPL